MQGLMCGTSACHLLWDSQQACLQDLHHANDFHFMTLRRWKVAALQQCFSKAHCLSHQALITDLCNPGHRSEGIHVELASADIEPGYRLSIHYQFLSSIELANKANVEP